MQFKTTHNSFEMRTNHSVTGIKLFVEPVNHYEEATNHYEEAINHSEETIKQPEEAIKQSEEAIKYNLLYFNTLQAL